MRHLFSDQNQQHQYFIEFNKIGDLFHVILSIKYQGAKFPDAIQSKVEFYLNENELRRFKALVDLADLAHEPRLL